MVIREQDAMRLVREGGRVRWLSGGVGRVVGASLTPAAIVDFGDRTLTIGLDKLELVEDQP